MKRKLVAALAVLAIGAAAAVAYTAAVRDREYRRLVEAGEEALATGQTTVAVEAFSGAIALKPGSMLGCVHDRDIHQPGSHMRNQILGDVDMNAKRYVRT